MDAQLKQRACGLFGGIGQEDIIEDTLGKVRDKQVRAASSKEMRCMAAWNVPVEVGQIAKFERNEVDITSVTDVADSGNYGHMFFPEVQDDADRLDLSDILKVKDWQTYNAMTLRDLPADLQLMRTCKKMDRLNGSEDAWWALLVPLHTAIIHRPPGEKGRIFFVLSKCPSGILTWPIRRTGVTCLTFGGGGSKSQWESVLALDHMEVVPFTPISPIHAFLLNDSVAFDNVGIMASHGKPIDLLEYQALNGFSDVPESAMLKLFKTKDWEVPLPEDDQDIDYDSLLAYDLVQRLHPDLDADGLLEVMSKRLKAATPACDGSLDTIMEDDMLEEVCGLGDKKVIKSHLASKRKDQAIRETVTPKFRAHVEKYCGKYKKGKFTMPLADKVKKYKLKTIDGIERWWHTILGDSKFIDEHRPSKGSVWQDDRNGRWRISYPVGHVRSVSWTTLGMETASVVVLKQLWAWHTAATGQQCPFPL